jgi:hypothetical protein
MRIRIGATMLILALTLVAGAQGHSSAPSAIKIGAIFDRSGPTSDVGVPYSDGVQAYVAWTNSRGGIKGRKIQLLSQDTSYNVARSEAFYQQLRTSGIVAISGWATADTEAFKARVAADRLPYVSASYAESVANPRETPYNFFVAPSYSQQMRIALKSATPTAPSGARPSRTVSATSRASGSRSATTRSARCGQAAPTSPPSSRVSGTLTTSSFRTRRRLRRRSPRTPLVSG